MSVDMTYSIALHTHHHTHMVMTRAFYMGPADGLEVMTYIARRMSTVSDVYYTVVCRTVYQ